MRIVLVNWAKIWDGAGYGGGANGYCQSLALALQERGHEVISLCGGRTYVRRGPLGLWRGKCAVRRHGDWLGVKVFEVVNSPVMAPSIVQYQEPLGEVDAPQLEAEVGRLLGLLKPDVVHFHNIEGFSIGCVEEARRAGARVVFSLHNYHTICPQVYLMQGHERVCHDSDNGHNCAGCIKTRPPREERRKLEKKHARSGTGSPEEEHARMAFVRNWARVKHESAGAVAMLRGFPRLVRGYLRIRRARLKHTWRDGSQPGQAVADGPSVHEALPYPEPPEALRAELAAGDAPFMKEARTPDQRGQTPHIYFEMNFKARRLDPESPEHRPLLNLARPDPPSSRPPNEYGRRRAAMVRMLNSCDRVLAVSNFVRDKFVAMGVDDRVIRTMAIGSRINRVVARAPELAFDPPAFSEAPRRGADGGPNGERPIRLVFMGYNNFYKGLHVFVEALNLLTPEYLRRLEVSIFALDGQPIEWMFRRMEPRLAKLTFVCGYNYHDIPWMLGGKDLGVVPSVWWDNAPQTVFEFFSCRVPVLGAAVGGIPDFVVEGHNGLLFRGNDPWDMARRLAEVVREPWKLTRMRSNIRRPKDIEDHATEMEPVYRGEDVRAVGLAVPAAASNGAHVVIERTPAASARVSP